MKVAVMSTEVEPVPTEEEASLLPGWLDEMLQPGVGAGVFTTLKLCLVGLIITLSSMLYTIQDEVCVRAGSTCARSRAHPVAVLTLAIRACRGVCTC